MMDSLMTGAALLVVVCIATAIYYFFFTEASPLKKKKGASKDLSAASSDAVLARYATRFAFAHGGKALSNVHLEKDGKSADFAAVIVGYYGVTALRGIPLGGEVFGDNATDETWLQVRGDAREKIPNPLLNVSADARLLRDALMCAKQRNVAVEVLPVFTNKGLTLAAPSGLGFYTMDSLKRTMGADKYSVDKKVDVDAVLAAIQNYGK